MRIFILCLFLATLQATSNAARESFLKGVIEGGIQGNFYDYHVEAHVDKHNNVILDYLPTNERVASSILQFARHVPGVNSARRGKPSITAVASPVQPHAPGGVWFPTNTVLFQPLLANPKEPTLSAAYRWGDDVLAAQDAAVAIGGIFPIYRAFDVFYWHGDLQIDISACVFAIFNMRPDALSHDLIDADYFVSIPITYAFGKWAYRLRLYHISTHIGDEFLVYHPGFDRLNPSFEVLDFISSYQFKKSIRVYWGEGFILQSDNSYPLKHWMLEYGFEWDMPFWCYYGGGVYGSPFLTGDLQMWEAVSYRPSFTVQCGYSWSTLESCAEKVRMFLEYHNGRSDGQFFKDHTHYIAFRLAWGY